MKLITRSRDIPERAFLEKEAQTMCFRKSSQTPLPTESIGAGPDSNYDDLIDYCEYFLGLSPTASLEAMEKDSIATRWRLPFAANGIKPNGLRIVEFTEEPEVAGTYVTRRDGDLT